jgi:hypothetical protein
MDTNPLLQRVDRMLGDAFPKLNKLRADEYFVDSDALSSYDILELLLMIERSSTSRSRIWTSPKRISAASAP